MTAKAKKSSSYDQPVPMPDVDVEPPPIGELDRNNFIAALMAGDVTAAAKALRELDELLRPEVEILADLFDGEPSLAHLFPYRLTLVQRGQGRPPIDALTKRANEQAITRALESIRKEFPKLTVCHRSSPTSGQVQLRYHPQSSSDLRRP